MTRRFPVVFLAISALALVPAASAGVITLGTAAGYAIYAGPSETTTYSNPGNITGSVALGANGSINGSGSSTINGAVYLDSGVSGYASGITPTGGYFSPYNLSQVYTDATTASIAAAALTATNTTWASGMSDSGSSSVTINATVPYGQTVVDIGGSGINFTGTGGLIINGTANENVIINVTGTSGDVSFANSGITLTGGITASQVLFNILGTGTALNITANNTFNGTFLVLSGNVSANDGTLNGELLAVNDASQTVNGTVGSGTFHDNSGFAVNYQAYVPDGGPLPTPEPATMTMLALGISGMLAARKRRQA
jgi:hypothetical protein